MAGERYAYVVGGRAVLTLTLTRTRTLTPTRYAYVVGGRAVWGKLVVCVASSKHEP